MRTKKMCSGESYKMSLKAVLLIIGVFLCIGVPNTFCQDHVPIDVMLRPYMEHLGNRVSVVLEEIRDTLVSIKNLQMCSAAAPLNCTDGWKKFQGSCYHISGRIGNWTQGLDYCRKLGGDYVKISSPEEQNFINNLSTDMHIFWIGLNDRTAEGRFRWSYDDSVPSYTKWKEGEPNNKKGDEDCAHIDKALNIWNDLPCSSNAAYACEKNLLPLCDLSEQLDQSHQIEINGTD